MRRIILWVVIAIVFFINLISFFNWRDNQIEKSADNYEKCILEKYNQTPIQCKDANNGKFCECKL